MHMYMHRCPHRTSKACVDTLVPVSINLREQPGTVRKIHIHSESEVLNLGLLSHFQINTNKLETTNTQVQDTGTYMYTYLGHCLLSISLLPDDFSQGSKELISPNHG